MKKPLDILFANPFERSIKKRGILSLSIQDGEADLSVIEVRGKSVSFESLIKEEWEPGKRPSPETLMSSLMPAVTEHVTNTKDVLLTVPDSWILRRECTLPVTALENIRDVLSFEMDHFTPFTSEQVYFDFHVRQNGSSDAETCNITLFVINRELISPFIDIFTKNGFKVLCCTTNQAALCSIARGVLERDILNLKTPQGNITVESGIPVSITNSGTSGIDGRVIVEIPETSEEKDLYEELFRKLDIDDALKDRLHLHAGSISYMLGYRILNFIGSGKSEDGSPPLGLSILLFLIILVAMGSLLPIPLIKGEKINSSLKTQIDSLKPRALEAEKTRKEIEEIKKKLSIIKEFKTGSPQMLLILKEITTIVPDDTWLTRLEVRGRSVTIEGYSDSATPLISLLENSDILKNVSFSSTTVKDRRTNKERFRIKAELQMGKADETEGK